MAMAAVPAYLGTDFSSASPGMRFGMYLQLWGTNNRTQERLWTMHDLNYRIAGRDRIEREFKDENKTAALRGATQLNQQDRQLMAALLERQTMLAERLQPSGQLLRVDADAIAPFTTGLGNEHPLENGFAFLNPYGLPYLPGSGVKGVLRQAARELASGEWGDPHGWNQAERFMLVLENTRIPMTKLDVLFGKESGDGETEHVRGALRFWDVYPQIPGMQLAVEVMTAHQSHYLQGTDTPHESGQPNPINFLSVPPGAGFHFHIQCDQPFLARLAPELAEPGVWQSLLNAALEHAFDWLGFGAKTAVGYGAMRRDQTAEQARLNAQRAVEEQRQHEEEERLQREEEQARVAQQQAAFEALPRSEQALRRFKEGTAQFTGEGPLNKDQYPEFSRLVNALTEQAFGWADSTERQRAVDLLTSALDRFGWSAPGVKADKRKKQETKRRQQIDGVINGHA
ncbi:MAG: type III-B CRISPR module RAMP protein Cmr6 [Lamprobacter sp.]|uniref:type III-B CRISPR module RAMP protein Cmr6 n=1 Tax=Lamprobacter sp. TaxID=3100796 RepID=UPI002B260965|nr:type III-B CRISPR module RAMP protein Cmr6 [Lamprobacter sp.]MEA3643123.1 type III-B CRISPR module RAMP protein Cmr6 [Lamprobacter sp.]